MAEVTVWIEEDGKRTSLSVEHADKQVALTEAIEYLRSKKTKTGFVVSFNGETYFS